MLPPRYPWPDGFKNAFCLTIDVDAESVNLWVQRDGQDDRLDPMEQRLFGPRIGIWRLLDMLKRYDISATLFVPGVVAERHPELLPAFVAAGHEIALHGYNHELPQDVSTEEFVAALDRSIAIFQSQTGVIPKGFRAPGAQLTEAMAIELAVRDLYDSSLSGADHPYSLDNLIEIPFQWILDDAVLLKFTGPGDKWLPAPPQQALDMWIGEWLMLRRFGGLFTLTLHDWISGRSINIGIIEKLLDEVTSSTDVWVTTAAALADYQRHQGGQFEFPRQIATPIARIGASKPG